MCEYKIKKYTHRHLENNLVYSRSFWWWPRPARWFVLLGGRIPQSLWLWLAIYLPESPIDLPQWLGGEEPVSSKKQVLQRIPEWAVSTGRNTGSHDLARTHCDRHMGCPEKGWNNLPLQPSVCLYAFHRGWFNFWVLENGNHSTQLRSRLLT